METHGAISWRGEPTFIMRVVQFHRSALSRQTGETVRIMRRGGGRERTEFPQ